MKKKNKIFSGRVRWLMAGVLILGIAGGGVYYYNSTRSKNAGRVTVTPVQTSTAFRGNIVLQASGTGTLTPANQVSFGFGTSGQIAELDVKIGDQVKAGQILGRIDDAQVKAAYDQARRTLEDLTTPAAIAQAQQAVADAAVSIYNARAELEHLISSDVYYWEGQVATAQQALASAQTEAGANPTADQKKKIDDATAALARAQTNLQAAHLRYTN